MTFSQLCERIEALGGEEVDFALLSAIPDVDAKALREGALRDKLYCFAPQRRHFLDGYFALPNSGMSFIAVYAVETEQGAAAEIFGAPYLDMNVEEKLYGLILGED